MGQGASVGLTQYDVEEVCAACSNRFKPIYFDFFPVFVEPPCDCCAVCFPGEPTRRFFTQEEVETLYWRFRSLDRGRKGFVTSEEFLAIPELSINPLAQRLVRMLDGCNFKDFVRFLASFSPKAKPEAKIRFVFEVYDVDGDGLVSREDLATMIRYLVGSQLREEQISALVQACFSEASTESGIALDVFMQHARSLSFEDMTVNIPQRL